MYNRLPEQGDLIDMCLRIAVLLTMKDIVFRFVCDQVHNSPLQYLRVQTIAANAIHADDYRSRMLVFFGKEGEIRTADLFAVTKRGGKKHAESLLIK